MGSFETIRKLASGLHAQLIADGINPLDPMAIAGAAASHLHLEICFLPAGDPILKGAKALFDGQSDTILCENQRTEVDRALLIAHEIGHAAAHQKPSTCSSEDIDLSQSTEAAPVGLQKVEDYGARERRELEANVYARELLFPRSLAKQLYTVDTLTSAQIAERTGLPIPLIRQQILDVILLPQLTVSDVKATTPPPAKEDPAQERAAIHRGAPFQLQAGPGSGKTRTLVRRIQSLLTDNIDPQSILVLTFSNRAAGELSERLSRALPEEQRGIWIGTFHAFGLDLVRRFHDRLGLPSNPTLFDRSDAIAVLEEILPTLPLQHYRNIWDPVIILREILQAISRAKDEMVGPEQYRLLGARMLESATTDVAREAAEKCLEIADVYARYEKAKAERGSIDFGDLIMLPALLLERDEIACQAVRLRHRHMLIDEYQDVNRASVRLVKAISGEGKQLWVVGDARQSIYRFRGATSANMAAFAEDFPSPKVDQLGVSYRSTQEVVDTFTQFSLCMGASRGMQPLALSANRGANGIRPQIRRFPTLDDEAAGIAASVMELKNAGIELRDQAVLCRTNKRLNEIAAALEIRGIPVLHLGSLFERDEVRDLLAILSLAVDHFGSGLVRIAAMERYAIPLQDVARLTKFMRSGDKPALQRLAELPSVAGLSPTAVTALKQLAQDLTGFTPSSSPWDLLTTSILDRSGLARAMAAGTTVGAQMQCIAVWQFLNFLRDQIRVAAGSPIQRTLTRVRNLVLLAEERDLRQVPAAALQMNAVRLMTAHGSKGLEFEAVHIPGLIVTGIPASYGGSRCPPPEGMIAGSTGSVGDYAKASHNQEEECLFFVAMSRARTHLRVYLSQLQPNGNDRKPSPYLDHIRGRVVEVTSPPMLPLPPDAPKPSGFSIRLPADWPLTVQRLTSYEKCPRRFFYTHVLGIGTARRTTPFDKTHECIYEFIEWLSNEQVAGSASLEKAEIVLEEIWQRKGPTDHAYANDYRSLAGNLARSLLALSAGRQFREAGPVAVNFNNGTVLVEPDEVAKREDGVVVIRRVRTGRKSQTEYDKLEYALYLHAAMRHFGAGAVVEAVHLSDNLREEVTLTPRKMQNRKETAEEILAGITGGQFPPKEDAFSCPRCPHFFICAAAPAGPLTVD